MLQPCEAHRHTSVAQRRRRARRPSMAGRRTRHTRRHPATQGAASGEAQVSACDRILGRAVDLRRRPARRPLAPLAQRRTWLRRAGPCAGSLQTALNEPLTGAELWSNRLPSCRLAPHMAANRSGPEPGPDRLFDRFAAPGGGGGDSEDSVSSSSSLPELILRTGWCGTALDQSRPELSAGPTAGRRAQIPCRARE